MVSSETLKELRKRHLEAYGQNLQRTETWLFFPILKVRNECPTQSRVNGKIRLRPAAPLTHGTDATPYSNANVRCHEYRIAVFFRLHIAYRIQTLQCRVGEWILGFREREWADSPPQ